MNLKSISAGLGTLAFSFSTLLLCAPVLNASTLQVTMPFDEGGSFENGDPSSGTPVVFDFTYDSTELTNASFSINGYTGAFETYSLSLFSTHVRTAYNNTVRGVEVEFVIDTQPLTTWGYYIPGRGYISGAADTNAADGIPHTGIDLNSISMVFRLPNDPHPDLSDPNTYEANLDSFFAAAPQVAVDWTYYTNSRGFRHEGQFYDPTSFTLTRSASGSGSNTGGGNGGTGSGSIGGQVPLPAPLLLMMSGLATLGLRRRG